MLRPAANGAGMDADLGYFDLVHDTLRREPQSLNSSLPDPVCELLALPQSA
jgi:hypothetical protein